MTTFDPLKAVREELTGLTDVLRTMRQRENDAEIAIAKAESELNAIRKLRGYAQVEVTALQERIRKLEAESV